MLNPWPGLSGMNYDICQGLGSTTGIMSDSKGHGAIRYLDFPGGKRVRVDTYLIPMSEISRKIGDKIRLCYWGFSPNPALTVNSAGYDRAGKAYFAHNIPLSKFSDYVMAPGNQIDPAQIPNGQSDPSLAPKKNVPMPKTGDAAPEISANDWINLKGPVSLVSLRGKVVLVEFWATWCGPCIEGIPHLNELQKKYAGKNFQLLSLVQEGHKTMDKFLTQEHVNYPIGLESGALEDYGIKGIPQAFVIDQSGKIIWQGDSASPKLEKTISDAVAEVK
jgi:thiol-disulfide isomerase/thioredoxin